MPGSGESSQKYPAVSEKLIRVPPPLPLPPQPASTTTEARTGSRSNKIVGSSLGQKAEARSRLSLLKGQALQGSTLSGRGYESASNALIW